MTSVLAAVLVTSRGCLADSSTSAVKLHINTSHGAAEARQAIHDAGLALGREVIITTSSELDGRPYLSPQLLINEARSIGATILSSSFSGWDYHFDSVLYLRHVSSGMLHVFAYEPKKKQPLMAPPPATFVTVNRLGGRTGGGIEFGMPHDYLSGKTAGTSPSAVTAQLAGLLAGLKYTHSNWNWFDVKAALRATAGNYARGYDPEASGYGGIDYEAANRLEAASSLPLFPPAAIVKNLQGDRLSFAVNSFRQGRRQADVLFRFRLRPFTVLSELGRNEILALGGEQVYSGDTSPLRNEVTIQIPHEAISFYVWFTRDNQGKHSRIENYCIHGPFQFKNAHPVLHGPRK